MIGKRLFVVLACLFVVMIGFGITLPVLRFCVERLAQAEGVTPEAIVMHVTLLTAGYKGFYYHFLDMTTGRRADLCELSTVDTSFLLAAAWTSSYQWKNIDSDRSC